MDFIANSSFPVWMLSVVGSGYGLLKIASTLRDMNGKKNGTGTDGKLVLLMEKLVDVQHRQEDTIGHMSTLIRQFADKQEWFYNEWVRTMGTVVRAQEDIKYHIARERA